jgi:tetratricopeptide (TPR) repeat protein
VEENKSMNTLYNSQFLVEFKLLLENQKYDEALILLDKILKENQISPYLLLMKSRLIQLSENDIDRGLEKAENCLLKAHEINCEDLEVIEDLFHLYDAVIPNKELAEKFSNMYLTKVARTVNEIQEMIDGI